MNHGKQLRLFLPDGNASGPRYYELVNWTGQALVVPVSRIRELVSGGWPEFEGAGVYMVRGVSEEGHPRLYIGESDGVAKRVQAHPSSVGFEVSEILLFASKDGNLTKTHVLWLETQLIQRAVKAKRITVTNSKQPDLRLLPKAEEATMKEFVENLELVAQTAGFNYFREVIAKKDSVSLPQLRMSLSKQGVKAAAIQNDDGFVVLEGSRASATTTPALAKGYAQQRDDLIDQGVLKLEEGGTYVFTVDSVFSSSSAAASIVAGYPCSGPGAWRDENGTRLGLLLKKEKEELGE